MSADIVDNLEEERLADYENWCTDLISSKSLERGLQSLFESKPGSWIVLSQLFRDAGNKNEPIPENLVATWLPSPHPHAPETLIHFVDNNSNWTMTAIHSQRKRLLDSSIAQPKKSPMEIAIADHFANHKTRIPYGGGIFRKYRTHDIAFKNTRPRQVA